MQFSCSTYELKEVSICMNTAYYTEYMAPKYLYIHMPGKNACIDILGLISLGFYP
jgi:hypothetical protein